MPCYDGRCSDDNKILNKRVDILTRMLCDAIKTIQKSYDTDVSNCSLETQVWWEEHEKLDKERDNE